MVSQNLNALKSSPTFLMLIYPEIFFQSLLELNIKMPKIAIHQQHQRQTVVKALKTKITKKYFCGGLSSQKILLRVLQRLLA